MTPDEPLGALVRLLTARRTDTARPVRAILAVSGGGDSLAMLLHVAGEATRLAACGLNFSVATVDHGLRREAAQEAETVGAVCRELGLSHTILRWRGWDGRGNLSEQAREARYGLLAAAARAMGAAAIVTAHTLDDQFETVLMQRDRGVARSAGMREVRDLAPGIALVRPFLSQSRDSLRAVLANAAVRPLLDPTNEDRRHARIRARDQVRAMAVAERRALSLEIGEARRRRADDDRHLLAAIREVETGAECERGEIRLDASRLRALSTASRIRLLARAVTAAGGALHPPRRDAIRRLDEALLRAASFKSATLGGARIGEAGGILRFRREYGRTGIETVAVASSTRHVVFDRRFDITLEPEPARQGGQMVAFATTGRGGEVERTLPMLIGVEGSLVAAHPALVAKIGATARTLAVSSRVRWRFMADLAHAETPSSAFDQTGFVPQR